MSLRLRIFCLLAFAPFSTACGGQSDADAIPPNDVAPRDGGGAPGPSTDASIDAGECASSVSFLGNEEPIVERAERAPEPAGGVIADGTYVLTSAILYTGAGGASGATTQTAGLTIRVAGGVTEIVADGGRSRATATYTVSGTTLATHQTCPSPRDQTVGFTAKPDTLVVFLSRTNPPSSTLVETLVRQ